MNETFSKQINELENRFMSSLPKRQKTTDSRDMDQSMPSTSAQASQEKESPNPNKSAQSLIDEIIYSDEEYNENSSDYEEEDREKTTDTGYLQQSIYQIKPKNTSTEDKIEAIQIFQKAEVPSYYTNFAETGPPKTKYGKFTLQISNKIISLLKGIQDSSITPTKFDLDCKDNFFNEILTHINAKYSATNIPEDCFRLPSTARSSLQIAYKSLSRAQQTLKVLFMHAEAIKEQFETENDQEAHELVRMYILPI